MRILVDGIAFQNSHQRGVQRYFREMLSRVAKSQTVDVFMSDPPVSEMPAGCSMINRGEYFSAGRANLPLRAIRKLRRQIAPTRFPGYSIFHSTFFTQSPEPDLPEVLTLHDLIPERFERHYHYWGSAHIEHKIRAMKSARKIICISHATAADAAAAYPGLRDKLCVVHHGADHFLTDEASDSNNLSATANVQFPENPYLLFVGDRERYKNFDLILNAMTESTWPAELHLIAAGPEPAEKESVIVRSRGLDTKVRFAGPVPDEMLREYFKRSTAFVFTSLCEGFGFPLLEAQSLKTPVLCSDTPVFREIGGDSPVYFDPENPAALSSAVAELLQGNREVLIRSGLENVKRFRWNDCAKKTIDVYQAALA